MVLALTLAAHAVVVALLWQATPWAQAGRKPMRIEVALIAPPPPPEPNPREQLKRAPDRTPIKLQASELLPHIAEPLAPVMSTIPTALSVPPVESPVIALVTAVAAESPIPSTVVVAAPPRESIPPRFDAAYLDNPPPSYPAQSRRAGEEGRVLLRVLVSADGRPQSVEIAHSSGSPRLDEAAIESVRRWRFVPARRGDENVAAHVNVPVVFSLRR